MVKMANLEMMVSQALKDLQEPQAVQVVRVQMVSQVDLVDRDKMDKTDILRDSSVTMDLGPQEAQQAQPL